MRHSKVQWILFAACFLLSLAASAAPPDGDRFWTTVGSAGTLDEKASDNVFFDHGVVQIGHPNTFEKSSGRLQTDAGGGAEVPDSAVIRYNVTAVDGLFGISGARMAVRYLDEGAHVSAQLVEVDIETGAEVTLLTFDSNDSLVPPLNGYQLHRLCARANGFDFVQKAYYIEATLTTSAIVLESAAGIEIIQLHTATCVKD